MDLPPDCLLDRRVRTDFNDGDEDDLIGLQPFKILRCVEKKASGFSSAMQGYASEVVQGLHIGVHLAQGPPGLSCLGLRGGSPLTKIEAVDKGIIVLTTTFLHDFNHIVYLVYDAVKGSLHMAPSPEDLAWLFTGLTVRVLIARPSSSDLPYGDGDYALVLLGKLYQVGVEVEDAHVLLIWRPRSLYLPPWSERKVVALTSSMSRSLFFKADTTFSSVNGTSCWVDLLRGITYCKRDILLANSNNLEFDFIPLPEELAQKSMDHQRSNNRVAQPVAYRAMSPALNQAQLRFVSIDGFLEPVDLKDRTVTVWWHVQEGITWKWKVQYKLSLETLWGFEGFGDLPRDLTPMYPVFSPNNDDVVYLFLGEYREKQSKWLFIPKCARYLLAVNQRHKTIEASVCLSNYFGTPTIPDIIGSDFCRHIHVVSLDLHILMTDTMKQLPLTSLDPLDYDEEEAEKLIKEEPWIWQGNLKDRPLPLPLGYYIHPNMARLTANAVTTL